MSTADYRKVHGKNGAGRFVVSEGVAPSPYLLPNEALPTLGYDTEDDRFEYVLFQGTIISAVADANGNTTIVPANGTEFTSYFSDGAATPETVDVPAYSVPIGATQQHAVRPFDKGTSLAVSWIAQAFVEWPAVAGLNDDVAPGDLIRSDAYGRPVKCSQAEAAASPWIVVGRVIETDSFATNFDDGLLSYMQLGSDPGALREVYAATQAGTYKGKLGIPANLDVAGVVGSFRVTLSV